VTRARRFLLLAALLSTLTPAPARAQIFIASRPDPPFAVGPLTIRATVTAALTPVELEVRWALDIPPGKSRVGIEQDIFLLWPGEVTSPLGTGKKDDALAQYVEARGEFETAIRLNPKLYDAHYLFARTCFQEGKLEEAVRHYADAARVRPEASRPRCSAGSVTSWRKSGDVRAWSMSPSATSPPTAAISGPAAAR